MESIIHFFQGEMPKPGLFSWFHILFFIAIIVATVLVSYFFRNAEEKVYKRILFIGWITVIILEIMKQIIKPFHYGPPSYWEYNFYDFPFHLCSMIFYLLPILIFVKKEKCPFLIDMINGFMSFFVLLSGLVVCVYTEIVMSNLIFTNIQTLVHHGTQVILGVYIFVWNRKNINIYTYFKSLIAFGVTASIAILINVAFYPRGIDMFYLNPLQITSLPLVYVVQEKAGFVVYLFGYLIVIFSLGLLVFFIETSIYKLILKKQKPSQ